MELSMVIDLMGVGVLFWCAGRMCHHLYLKGMDSGVQKRAFYYAAIVFCILGNFSSLLISLVDGICHKRLFYRHLSELREVRRFASSSPDFGPEADRFYYRHYIGPGDPQEPMDIPESWYSLR